MKKDSWFLIYSLAFLLGVSLGMVSWLWFTSHAKKIPEAATLVMHNI